MTPNLQNKPPGLRRAWVPYIILGITLALTLFAARSVALVSQANERAKLDRAVERTREQFQRLINGNLVLLDGLRGLASAKLSMGPGQFHAYVEALQLRQNYPGVQGLGFAWRVTQADKAARIEKMRQAYPPFHIWPDSEQAEMCPVIYLSPPDKLNTAEIGYDLYSDPLKRSALERAVETGRPAASAKFALSPDAAGREPAGLLLVTPVFYSAKIPSTPEQRAQTLFGFFFCSFRLDDLFRVFAAAQADSEIVFKVYDGVKADAAQLLYDSTPVQAGTQPDQLALKRTLTVADHTWMMVFSKRQEFVKGSGNFFNPFILVTGTVISFLAFGITRTRAKARAVAEAHAESERLAEARFRRLVEQSLVGIYVIQDDRFAYVNPKMAEIFGCTEEELTSRPVFDFVAEESLPIAKEHMRQRLAGEIESVHYSLRGLRKDGTEIDLEAHGGRVEYRGQPAILGCLIDITDRQRAEREIRELNATLERRVAERTAELEATNKELESFSYAVSHDLRSPLQGIAGFAQALSEDHHDKLDASGQAHLKWVLSATERMTELIEDLLNLSRVSRAELNRRTVDLSALARRVLEDLQPTAPDRHVEVAIADGITVSGDLRLLRIVLENLLGNAWKFTSKKTGARIEFGVTTDSAGRRVCFVRDNGAGFDMAYASQLFGAFRRLHGTDEFPGTGIGLATVQRIILRHGGRVWAEAAVNEGATFYFSTDAGDRELPSGKALSSLAKVVPTTQN